MIPRLYAKLSRSATCERRWERRAPRSRCARRRDSGGDCEGCEARDCAGGVRTWRSGQPPCTRWPRAGGPGARWWARVTDCDCGTATGSSSRRRARRGFGAAAGAAAGQPARRCRSLPRARSDRPGEEAAVGRPAGGPGGSPAVGPRPPLPPGACSS